MAKVLSTLFLSAMMGLGLAQESSTDESANGEGGSGGGLFVDLRLGDPDNFLHLGSGLGYMRVNNSYHYVGDYTVDWEDTDWTWVDSSELGAIIKLGRNTDLRVAYDFTRVDDLNTTTSTDGKLNYKLGNLHRFKVGFVHFFRRK